MKFVVLEYQIRFQNTTRVIGWGNLISVLALLPILLMEKNDLGMYQIIANTSKL